MPFHTIPHCSGTGQVFQAFHSVPPLRSTVEHLPLLQMHDPWFKKTVFGLECCFLFIPRLDPNIVIPPSYVKLGEDICVLHLTDEIGNKRQGVSIPNSELVQLS